MTINEPNCFIGISYKDACHAPFLDDKNALISCTRNVLLANERAVNVILDRAKLNPVVGMAPTGPIYVPENKSKEAYEKAYALTFSNNIRGPFSMGLVG